MITGILNIHPEVAMTLLKKDDSSPEKNDFLKFYEKLTAEQTED